MAALRRSYRLDRALLNSRHPTASFLPHPSRPSHTTYLGCHLTLRRALSSTSFSRQNHSYFHDDGDAPPRRPNFPSNNSPSSQQPQVIVVRDSDHDQPGAKKSQPESTWETIWQTCKSTARWCLGLTALTYLYALVRATLELRIMEDPDYPDDGWCRRLFELPPIEELRKKRREQHQARASGTNMSSPGRSQADGFSELQSMLQQETARADQESMTAKELQSHLEMQIMSSNDSNCRIFQLFEFLLSDPRHRFVRDEYLLGDNPIHVPNGVIGRDKATLLRLVNHEGKNHALFLAVDTSHLAPKVRSGNSQKHPILGSLAHWLHNLAEDLYEQDANACPDLACFVLDSDTITGGCLSLAFASHTVFESHNFPVGFPLKQFKAVDEDETSAMMRTGQGLNNQGEQQEESPELLTAVEERQQQRQGQLQQMAQHQPLDLQETLKKGLKGGQGQRQKQQQPSQQQSQSQQTPPDMQEILKEGLNARHRQQQHPQQRPQQQQPQQQATPDMQDILNQRLKGREPKDDEKPQQDPDESGGESS